MVASFPSTREVNAENLEGHAEVWARKWFVTRDCDKLFVHLTREETSATQTMNIMLNATKNWWPVMPNSILSSKFLQGDCYEAEARSNYNLINIESEY